MRRLHGLGPVVALALAALCSGCTGHPSEASPPGPHPAPTRAGDCTDLPLLGGDPGILLGTDWSGEHHDFADSVVVYACVTASLGGRVSIVAEGTGIRTRPRSVPVDRSGSGVVPFRVRVSPEASGGLRVVQEGGGGGGDLGGPAVIADADGWRLARRE